MTFKPTLVGILAALSGIAGVARMPVTMSGQAPHSLSLTQDLRIDADEQDLGPIGFVAVAPNGTIVLGQPQDGHIKFFDARGAAIGAFGRKGQGPGEFQSLLRSGWLADSLWVSDGSTRRYTVLTSTRALGRTVPWVSSPSHSATSTSPPKYTFISPRSLVRGDAQLVVASLSPDSPWPGGKRTDEVVLRTSPEGMVRRVVAWRTPVECLVNARSGDVVVSAILPFCASPIDDVSPDGSRYAVAEVVADSPRRGRYRLSVYSTSGEALWSRVYSYEPVSIPRHVSDSVVSSRTSRLPPAQVAAWRAITLPSFYPPLSRVLAGRDQTTWVETYSLSGDRQWRMLNEIGDIAATMSVPRSLRVMVATRDTIWATETGDDGLQSVVRFRVSR